MNGTSIELFLTNILALALDLWEELPVDQLYSLLAIGNYGEPLRGQELDIVADVPGDSGRSYIVVSTPDSIVATVFPRFDKIPKTIRHCNQELKLEVSESSVGDIKVKVLYGDIVFAQIEKLSFRSQVRIVIPPAYGFIGIALDFLESGPGEFKVSCVEITAERRPFNRTRYYLKKDEMTGKTCIVVHS